MKTTWITHTVPEPRGFQTAGIRAQTHMRHVWTDNLLQWSIIQLFFLYFSFFNQELSQQEGQLYHDDGLLVIHNRNVRKIFWTLFLTAPTAWEWKELKRSISHVDARQRIEHRLAVMKTGEKIHYYLKLNPTHLWRPDWLMKRTKSTWQIVLRS
jgi:hypothetical protein